MAGNHGLRKRLNHARSRMGGGRPSTLGKAATTGRMDGGGTINEDEVQQLLAKLKTAG